MQSFVSPFAKPAQHNPAANLTMMVGYTKLFLPSETTLPPLRLQEHISVCKFTRIPWHQSRKALIIPSQYNMNSNMLYKMYSEEPTL